MTAPLIAVTCEPPPDAVVSPVPRRSRPRLLAIAREILKAPPGESDALAPVLGGEGRQSAAAGPVPGARRLVLDPAAALGPIAARVDRLIRAILADPKALNPRELVQVAARAARRQDPLAPPRIVEAALAVLKPWVAGPLAQEVARSPEVVRAVPWTISWPAEVPAAPVFEGRLDFAYRDGQGDWHLLVLSLAEAPEASERLRLLLSARAAAELKAGPIVHGCRVRLGPGGGLHDEDAFDAASIQQAIRTCDAGFAPHAGADPGGHASTAASPVGRINGSSTTRR